MAYRMVLAILHSMAVIICVNGMYSSYIIRPGFVGFLCLLTWFFLGFVSNSSGLLANGMYIWEADDQKPTMSVFLQYYYLVSWFNTTVGYTTLVIAFWLKYYQNPMALFHLLLTIFPLYYWIQKENDRSVLSSQSAMAIAIVSHLIVCSINSNWWGLIGALLMIVILMSLSVPANHNFFNFLPAKYCFIWSMAFAHFVTSIAVDKMRGQNVIDAGESSGLWKGIFHF